MKKFNVIRFIASAAIAISAAITPIVDPLNCDPLTLNCEAATLDDINRPEVFLKQTTSVSCTRCAAAMLLRRVAIMRGDSDWMSITEEDISSSCWLDVGLSWDFTYHDIRIVHGWLPEDYSSKVNKLIDLLNSCPEGIIGYDQNHHAILLVSYSDGVFYCAEPANSKKTGIIPVDESLITIADMDAFWYCASPLVSLSDSPDVESHISVSDARYPEGELHFGEIFSVAGVINSNYPLRTVYGGVYYEDHSPASEILDFYPNSTRFDLYESMDWDLKFDTLATGTYLYSIYAEDDHGFTTKVIESHFTVVDTTPTITEPVKTEPTTTTTTTTAETTTTTTTATTTEPLTIYRQGDVNNDKSVDVSDAVLLARFCAEDPGASLTSNGLKAADTNCDGGITLDDVNAILKLIAKMI